MAKAAKTKATAAKAEKTIIARMCSISEKMKEVEPDFGGTSGNMPICNMKKAAADIRELARIMEFSEMQVVILTAIVKRTARYSVSGNDLAEELGMEYLQFLNYSSDLDELRRRGYVRINKEGDIVLPKEILNNLKENRPVKPEKLTGLSTTEIYSRIRKILSICYDDECSADEASDYISTLMELNPEASISKAWNKYLKHLNSDERLFVAVMLYRYYYYEDDRIMLHDIDDYFSDDGFDLIRGEFRREHMQIQREGIIEYVGEDGMRNKEVFKIKDEIQEEFLSDVGGIKKDGGKVKISASRKLAADAIAEKELFYNDDENRQIAQLRELMSAERYDEIRSRLSSKGLRTGFTCLFYGAPGTGKTETAYQIARGCDRDLYIIDVSKIKSCWVGESEKNIKNVFDKYRAAVKENDGPVPILLFNEADAIFGVRAEGAERAVDKMENSIQNIILQEMEDLDGILIATTNLTTNLDKAFERRFLYKIRFDKPCAEASSHIWASMIPELSQEQARTLAVSFDFSGGQIENISRKKAVKELIDGGTLGFEQILQFCNEENIEEKAPRKRIGF